MALNVASTGPSPEAFLVKAFPSKDNSISAVCFETLEPQTTCKEINFILSFTLISSSTNALISSSYISFYLSARSLNL